MHFHGYFCASERCVCILFMLGVACCDCAPLMCVVGNNMYTHINEYVTLRTQCVRAQIPKLQLQS